MNQQLLVTSIESFATSFISPCSEKSLGLENIVKRIKEKLTDEPPAAKENESSINLNAFIQKLVQPRGDNRTRNMDSSEGVSFRLDLSSEIPMLVKTDVQRLGREVDLLIDVAREVLVNTNSRELTISTRFRANGAAILIEKTRRAIPLKDRSLLQESREILELNEEKICVQSLESGDVTLSVWLPLEWLC